MRDQARVLLHNHIVSGRISPGTKLVERDLAESFGISRAPVRDALIELEEQGLVVTKPNGRYVIELSERDIRELFQVRLVVEALATDLATQHISPAGGAELSAKLQEMSEALPKRDYRAFIDSDVGIHRLIWRMADSHYLYRVLNSMVGPMFMLSASHAEHKGWSEILDVHADLVDCVSRGDSEGARESVRRHHDDSLCRSIRYFVADTADEDASMSGT